MTGITYDKERIHLNLAKLKKGKENFEIDIDADSAVAYKEGKAIDIKDILKAQTIFSDAKKGLVASEHLMQQLFGTSDSIKVAEIIIKEGEIQLTAEYREKLRQNKRRRIIDIIHRNAVDPKTHLPHPVQRIENAFDEAKVKIDEFKSAEKQLQDVLKKLRMVLPIRFEVKEMAVKIPAEYAAKSYSIVKSFGTIQKEDWQSDGSWIVVVEVPGGLEQDFYDKLNSFTHGNNETKVLKVK
jgi:ribosome maturation protein SDO1